MPAEIDGLTSEPDVVLFSLLSVCGYLFRVEALYHPDSAPAAAVPALAKYGAAKASNGRKPPRCCVLRRDLTAHLFKRFLRLILIVIIVRDRNKNKNILKKRFYICITTPRIETMTQHCKTCRKDKEPSEFVENGRAFKTCNVCRLKIRKKKKGSRKKCDACKKTFVSIENLRIHTRKNCNPNEYKIVGDYVEIRLGKPNNGKGSDLYKKEKYTTIDLVDFTANKMLFMNTAITMDKNGYASIVIGGKNQRLHRFLMGDCGDRVVDHINHDVRDNRKENLRLATPQQNCFNSKRNSNNSTGYKGVSINSAYNKYAAQIYFNNKRIFLGYFDCPNTLIVRKKLTRSILRRLLNYTGSSNMFVNVMYVYDFSTTNTFHFSIVME
jgi:hypothetical protein